MTLTNAVNAGTANVTLKPFTVTTNIDIGGADAAGTLGLTSTEMQNVTAGTLTVGSVSGTGTTAVTTALASSDINAATLQLINQDVQIGFGVDFRVDNEDLTLIGSNRVEFINLSGVDQFIELNSGDLLIQGGDVLLTSATPAGPSGPRIRATSIDITGTSFTIVDNSPGGDVKLDTFNTIPVPGAISVSVSGDIRLEATAPGSRAQIEAGNTLLVESTNGNIQLIANGGIGANRANAFINAFDGSETVSAPNGTILLQNSSGTGRADIQTCCTSTPQTIIANEIRLESLSTGVDSRIRLEAANQQDIDVTGGIFLVNRNTTSTNGIRIDAGGTFQQIDAGFIVVESDSTTSSARIRMDGAGPQTINTTSKNVSGEGILLTGTGDTRIECTGACTGQNITVANADALILQTLAAGAGSAEIRSVTTQNITLQGSGLNHLIVGGGQPGRAEIIGNQTISVGMADEMGEIRVEAGSGDGNDAIIRSLAAQVLAVQGSVIVTGGTSAAGNQALIEATTTQNITAGQDISVTGGASGFNNDARIRALGGLQDLTAGATFTASGGPGGNDNGAFINGDLGATIAAVNMQVVGGGIGVGNEGEIDTKNAAQTITLSGSLLVQGSAGGGDDNFGGIFADSGQSITTGSSAADALKVLGGNNSVSGLGNHAIITQTGATFTQQITLNNGGDLVLEGGAGVNNNFAQITNAGGMTTIQKGAGTGTLDVTLKGGTGMGLNDHAAITATNALGNDINLNIDGNLTLTGGGGGGGGGGERGRGGQLRGDQHGQRQHHDDAGWCRVVDGRCGQRCRGDPRH